MFRSKKNDSDDSGDEREDGAISDDMEMSEPKAKKSNSVWSEVILEQTLEDRSSRVCLDKGAKSQRVARGAESYEVPADLAKEATKPKEEKPLLTVTPASDNPFSDSTDISAVEGFGVDSYKSKNRRNFRGGMRGRESYRGRGVPMRGGQRFPVGRGGGPQGVKRNWQGKGNNDFVKTEYSLETLMSAEFATGLNIDQLGKEIALALGEFDPDLITKIVVAIGEERALAIFEETRQVESSGGMKILDGSRRRTPGGVYIMLVKSDMDISPEVKDNLFQQTKIEQRKIQKARRSKSYGNSLKEMERLLEKEKKSDPTETEGELKKLPEVSDVFMPESSSATVENTPYTDEIDIDEMES